MKLFIALFIALFFYSTNCDQEFRLIGISHGFVTTTVWIQEDVGGECSYSLLSEVCIDTGWHAFRSANNFSGDSAAARRFIRKNFDIDSLRVVKRSADSFTYRDVFSLTTPADNPRLREKFEKGEYFAYEWNRMMGDSGIVPPVVSKGKLDLLYASPEGFYVNYYIVRCWYSETAKLVILFTNGCEGPSGDTTNGYMIFRVNDKK